MFATLSNRLHHRHRGWSWSPEQFVMGVYGTENSLKLKQMLTYFFYKQSHSFEMEWNAFGHAAAALYIPSRMENCVWHCFYFLIKQPAQRICTVTTTEIPEGIGMIDASLSWLPPSFFSPKTTQAWMQPGNEKTTLWIRSDTNLTSRLCATPRLLFLANAWRLPFLNYVDSQLLTYPLPFPLSDSVCVCLCSIRQHRSLVNSSLCVHSI